jgi:hypothetical protein
MATEERLDVSVTLKCRLVRVETEGLIFEMHQFVARLRDERTPDFSERFS